MNIHEEDWSADWPAVSHCHLISPRGSCRCRITSPNSPISALPVSLYDLLFTPLGSALKSLCACVFLCLTLSRVVFLSVCRLTPVRWRLYCVGCPAPSDRSWPGSEPVWRNAGTSAASRASRAHRLCSWHFWDVEETTGSWGNTETLMRWEGNSIKLTNIKGCGLYLAVQGHRGLSTDLRSGGNVTWAFQGLCVGGRDIKMQDFHGYRNVDTKPCWQSLHEA